MSDPSREIQRYLNQPLDALMQEFDVYAEEVTGVRRGSEAAWAKIALALAAMIDNETLRIVAPATLIAVILFKRRIDQFCGCEPLGAKKEN